MALARVPELRIEGVRARGLAAVASRLESRQSHRADAILVTGRAGFGKSLLASQALDLARRMGWRTVSFAGSKFAFQSMLAAQVAEQLGLPPALSELALMRGIRDECRRLGTQGERILMVIDGIEELNAADLGLLENLILFSPSQHLQILMTHRVGDPGQQTEPISRALTRLWNSGALHTLSLEPMTETEVGELCAERFPSGSVTPRFVRDLLAFSGGNPQWIQELIARIIEIPDVLRSAVLSGSEFVRGAGLPAPIPSVVESRFGAYVEERFLAEALSVHAVPATVEVLVELTRRPEREVEAAVGRLEQGGILAAFPAPGPWPAYFFPEPVVAAALRVLMPRSTWFRLLKDTLAIARARPEVVDADLLRAAILRLDAADPFAISDQTVVLRASRALIRRSRFESARVILTRMLERSTGASLPVSDETLVLLAESQARTGATEVNRLLVRPVEGFSGQQTQYLMKQAKDAISRGDQVEAATLYDRLLADESTEPLMRVHILLDAARLHRTAGRPDLARRLCESAAALANAVGQIGLAGLARLEEFQVSIGSGRSAPRADVATAFAQAGLGDSGTVARAVSHMAAVVLDRGSVPRALRWWRRAARLADHAGDYSSLPAIQLNLARAEIEAGEWAHAEQTIASAVHINASLHRMEELQASLAVQRLLAALRRRSIDRGHLDLPTQGLRAKGDQFTAVLDNLARFEHHIRSSQLDEAEQAVLNADVALADLEGHERVRLTEILPRLASLHAETGDLARLKGIVALFEQQTVEGCGALVSPLHDLALANVLALEGDFRRAVDLLGQSSHVLTRLGYRWRGALAHRSAAIWSRRAGFTDETKTHLQAAFELFVEMDAAADLDQIRTEMLSVGLRARRRTGGRQTALTARQRGIAELAGQGMSDPEIAERLGISRRTVSTHMHRVLKGTGLRSRTQLEMWISSNPDPGYAVG